MTNLIGKQAMDAEMLGRFCGVGSNSPFVTPFLVDGYYYATNGNVTLRVPAEMVEGEVLGCQPCSQYDLEEIFLYQNHRSLNAFEDLDDGFLLDDPNYANYGMVDNYQFNPPSMVGCHCLDGTVFSWDEADEGHVTCRVCGGTIKHASVAHDGEQKQVVLVRLGNTSYAHAPLYALVADVLGREPMPVTAYLSKDARKWEIPHVFWSGVVSITLSQPYLPLASAEPPDIYWDAPGGKLVVGMGGTDNFSSPF
ncbi:MAG: hypothetical protein PHE17_17785 [Thiothrix sp.]|uniref:hypothetical protein n=1 Tax=Thiothrix sp. TaxID=1032 RepID=UPI00261264B3|nr:hypothetical protein [Thiothrix sp.]MDD5394873.1 hypothetical protein [Thiothrix sp.]